MKQRTKTILALSTLAIGLMSLQGCGSLNEAAGKFNREVLDPVIEKMDQACGYQGYVCSNDKYRELGYFDIHDFQIGAPIWHKPNSPDEFFAMCESDRFSCGNKHYDFHPNWELRGTTYVNLAYGEKHIKNMQEFARHEDSYNQVIKVGTQICKVNEGYTDEVGYTEKHLKDSDKIQIRLASNGFLIWDDALNWYTCQN